MNLFFKIHIFAPGMQELKKEPLFPGGLLFYDDTKDNQ